MNVQRVPGGIKAIRAGVVWTRNLVIHVNSTHVTSNVVLVLEFGAAQVARAHLRLWHDGMDSGDVFVQLAFPSEWFRADLTQVVVPEDVVFHTVLCGDDRASFFVADPAE